MLGFFKSADIDNKAQRNASKMLTFAVPFT